MYAIRSYYVAFIEQSFDKVSNDIRHWKLFYSLMLQPHIAENFTERYAKAAEPFFKMIFRITSYNVCYTKLLRYEAVKAEDTRDTKIFWDVNN